MACKKSNVHPCGEHLACPKSLLLRVFRAFRGSNSSCHAESRIKRGKPHLVPGGWKPPYGAWAFWIGQPERLPEGSQRSPRVFGGGDLRIKVQEISCTQEACQTGS